MQWEEQQTILIRGAVGFRSNQNLRMEWMKQRSIREKVGNQPIVAFTAQIEIEMRSCLADPGFDSGTDARRAVDQPRNGRRTYFGHFRNCLKSTLCLHLPVFMKSLADSGECRLRRVRGIKVMATAPANASPKAGNNALS